MKKIVYVFVLFVGVLLLTACGKHEKSLKCSLSQKINGSQDGEMIIEETVTYDEDEGEFTKLHFRVYVDLTKEKAISDNKKQEILAGLESRLQGVCDEALKKGADSCSVSAPKEFVVEINSEADVASGAMDEGAADLGTLEEMRAYFEAQNYTCEEE